MGICMPAEVRKEIKQIEAIYHKTCELKQHKRVLIVGSNQSGKTELINQAISTSNSFRISTEEYLEFAYSMGPFIINEYAKPEKSLGAWEYNNEIISWDNTLSYYPPIYDSCDDSNNSLHSYDFYIKNNDINNIIDLLLTGYCRKYAGINFLLPKIKTELYSYFPRPIINSIKDEIIDENLIEFWELSQFDYAFWTYCIKQIIGIIFVVDMSCYDEFYYDPINYTKTQNKMTETIQKFKQMLSNQYLIDCNNVSVTIFFNKIDTFKQKVTKGISIKTCPDFKDYNGDEYNWNECMNFIKSKFDQVNSDNDRLIYLRETCAIYKGDVNELNLLGTISNDINSENINNLWHKFGANLNYHWNELTTQ
eukprot:509721_1